MRATVKYSGADSDFEADSTPGEVLSELLRERPAAAAFGVVALMVLTLVAAKGLHNVARMLAGDGPALFGGSGYFSRSEASPCDSSSADWPTTLKSRSSWTSAWLPSAAVTSTS
jgi:hypothetical protein